MPTFMSEEAEPHRGLIGCSKSHKQQVAELDFQTYFVSKVLYTMVPVIKQERWKHTQLPVIQIRDCDKYQERGIWDLLWEHREGSCSSARLQVTSGKSSQRMWYLSLALKINGGSILGRDIKVHCRLKKQLIVLQGWDRCFSHLFSCCSFEFQNIWQHT